MKAHLVREFLERPDCRSDRPSVRGFARLLRDFSAADVPSENLFDFVGLAMPDRPAEKAARLDSLFSSGRFKVPFGRTLMRTGGAKRFDGHTMFALVKASEEEGRALIFWSKDDRAWPFFTFVWNNVERSKHYECLTDERGEIELSETTLLNYSFRAFLEPLHFLYYERPVLRRVDYGGAIQRKRAASGKGPLLSYFVVDLSKPRSSQSQGAGGTHASPRLHWVMGHWRTLTDAAGNEREIWIKSHERGVGPGRIFKDYVATAARAGAATLSGACAE